VTVIAVSARLSEVIGNKMDDASRSSDRRDSGRRARKRKRDCGIIQ
jgi:hypothetical protein